MAANIKEQRDRYTIDSVMSATPARLLTMLYDRLLLDLGRAHAAHGVGDWAVASTNLLHAQDIIAELSSSLRVEAWDGAEGLLGLYNYIGTALISANIQRDTAAIAECIALLEPLRQTWHEAAAQVATAQPRQVASGGTLGVA